MQTMELHRLKNSDWIDLRTVTGVLARPHKMTQLKPGVWIDYTTIDSVRVVPFTRPMVEVHVSNLVAGYGVDTWRIGCDSLSEANQVAEDITAEVNKQKTEQACAT